MDLLILGASVRGASFSALRIGLQPTGIDLFADADLGSACPAIRVDPAEYPEGLVRLADERPPMPWMYTGALENRPDLVDRISDRHRLMGNSGEILRAVRDPIALAGAVRGAGLVAPEIRLEPADLPVDGSWLCKPLASAGGQGIGLWVGRSGEARRSVTYQERIEGVPASAIFTSDRAGVRILGLTRQFVGKGSNRFAYRGSLAPWPASSELLVRVERLGEVIGQHFGLRGLFGIDLILKDGQPWPIEVNPRYTASVEVIEWASGRSLLAEHFSAFGMGIKPGMRSSPPVPFVAKAIVYATHDFRWISDRPNTTIDLAEFPDVADIPRPGTTFRPGDPVLSVFARGDSPAQCRANLATRLRAWNKKIRASMIDRVQSS